MEYILAGIWKGQMANARLLRSLPGKLFFRVYLRFQEQTPTVPHNLKKKQKTNKQTKKKKKTTKRKRTRFSFSELGPVLHQCHVIAAEMVHFVQQVQYYINFEVLECSWDELLNKVTQAEDLDCIIRAHEIFLDTVISRSFIDQNSTVSRM